MDDPESDLRELKSALALMTGMRLANTRLQDVSGCAISPKLALCGMQRTSFYQQRYLTRCGLLRQRSDFWTLVQMTHVMATSPSDTKVLTTLCRVAQEPSSGSGVKRSNLEAIRSADEEAEKAVKRAEMLEERRSSETSICNTDG